MGLTGYKSALSMYSHEVAEPTQGPSFLDLWAEAFRRCRWYGMPMFAAPWALPEQFHLCVRTIIQKATFKLHHGTGRLTLFLAIPEISP